MWPRGDCCVPRIRRWAMTPLQTRRCDARERLFGTVPIIGRLLRVIPNRRQNYECRFSHARDMDERLGGRDFLTLLAAAPRRLSGKVMLAAGRKRVTGRSTISAKAG